MEATFDARWHRAAVRGAPQAIDRLAHEALGPLYRFCLYRVGRDRHVCQEVVQETLVTAIYRRCRQSQAMWQLAAEIAERQGMTARALQCTQQMLLRKYENLSGAFNVEAVRDDYGTLLQQYEQLAKSIATLDSQPSGGFLARVIRAADRWRSIDPDPTTACQTAARIFGDLGAFELAWDYLTTPLADHPNEAAPWVSMARMLSKQGRLDLADRAYASAFDAESTNAQILWDRAQILIQAGRTDDANRLLQQIAEGQWPRQFNGIQTRAKQYVESQTVRNASSGD